MILSLPVLATFSATLPIDHGEANCGFLTLIMRPVLPAASSRSVCRARNAGTCRTSQTSATGAAWEASWMSVRIGRASCRERGDSVVSGEVGINGGHNGVAEGEMLG